MSWGGEEQLLILFSFSRRPWPTRPPSAAPLPPLAALDLTAAPDVDVRKCSYCGVAAMHLRACSSCRVVSYCSRSCQGRAGGQRKRGQTEGGAA